MWNYGGDLIAKNVRFLNNNAADYLCLPKQRASRGRDTHRSLLPLGLAQGAAGAIRNQHGGAINSDGNADIKDCKFEGNTAGNVCRRVRPRQH